MKLICHLISAWYWRRCVRVERRAVRCKTNFPWNENVRLRCRAVRLATWARWWEEKAW
jgi:hypothetical protein